MIELTWLAVHINGITGSLPVEYAALTNLRLFSVRENELTGKVPVEFAAQWSEIDDVQLQGNSLRGAVPFCSPGKEFARMIADCAEMQCPCCTSCIYRGG